MKIMLGLPTTDGKFDVLVIHSIVNQLDFIIDGHHEIKPNIVRGTMIHNARNAIAESALKEECDYVFFVDSDCVLPENTLRRLVQHDKDIVAGMYFQKQAPFWPVIYRENEKELFDVITDYPKDQLVEVDGIGMGVCLIKTKVLRDIGDDPFNPYRRTKRSPFINAEDLAFCIRARNEGYKIFVDTGIQAPHQTVRYIDEDYHKAALAKIEKQMKEKGNG